MTMKIMFQLIKSLFIVIIWKVKFRNKLKISLFQLINYSIKLEINGKSRVNIDKLLACRRNLQLIVDNANLTIKENCFFNQNCSITALNSITIGKNCCFGNNVVIVDHDHNYKVQNGTFITAPIIIGDNVWIGANTVILKGVKIGDNVVIAAGSVINQDIENNTLIYEEKKYNKKIIK